MKKLAILALAAVLVIFFTLPAAALENVFGGYWRTRYFSQKYFSGYDRGDRTGVPIIDDDGDVIGEERAEDDTIERADTRTRLYYTAKINDNLKLVNKFEMDATFGGGDSRGGCRARHTSGSSSGRGCSPPSSRVRSSGPADTSTRPPGPRP